MFRQSLQLTLGQTLKMTPQMQQAIRLLQWSTVDLRAHLSLMLETNVLLEQDETDREPYVTGSAPSTSNALDIPAPTWADGGLSLRTHLLEQLEIVPLASEDLAIATALVDALNEDGYLTESPAEIVAELKPDLVISEADVLRVLEIVQALEPAGVGARSLAECLALQLAQLDPDTPGLALARDIVGRHLELLALRDPTPLRRALDADEETLAAAIALVRSCHPRPGSGLGGTRAEFVIPDIVVRRTERGWSTALSAGALPRISLNQRYAALLGRAVEYSTLRTQLQEARWLLKSLEIRNETLLKVARSIVERQTAFLERGEEHMQPLVLREIAELTGLHESTVSRITSGKYLLTPRGVFELRYFFSSRVDDETGAGTSSTAIRARIRKLIREENPADPLSDGRIAALLAGEGIPVARRTVAKYRETLGIGSSTERKQAGSR